MVNFEFINRHLLQLETTNVSLLSLQKELNQEIKEKTITLEAMKVEQDELLTRKKAEEQEADFVLTPQTTFLTQTMMQINMPAEYAPEDIISYYHIQSNFLKEKSYNKSKFCF